MNSFHKYVSSVSCTLLSSFVFIYFQGAVKAHEGGAERSESEPQSNGPELNEQLQLAISGDTENPFAKPLSQGTGSS